MIQRIQTLWLLLSSACSVAVILLPFYAGNSAGQLYETLTGQSYFHLLLITVAVGVSSLISVFLYKKRKIQMQIASIALLLQLLNIFFFIQKANEFVDGNYTISSLFSFLIPLFLILAILGIRKDEQLIKNMDRFR